MGWEILLGAVLEAGLGLLAEAGFGDEARDLKDRLTKRAERARRAAFERAFQQALHSAGEEQLRPLLAHRPFQEGVITGLLDPQAGFDLAALRESWEQALSLSPADTRALRRFFAALENSLLADETWGPLLQRYQDLRFREDVVGALQRRGAGAETAHLVAQVNARLQGAVVGRDVHGDVVTGTKTTVFDQGGQTVETQINVAGDYIVQGATDDPLPAPPTSEPPRPAAGWNTSALRQLLSRAFSDEELTSLCFDHFYPVYEQFGGGMSKADKIQRLVAHCARHEQLEGMLAVVRERNPAQYARFAGRLKG